jgi:hypothetical protein
MRSRTMHSSAVKLRVAEPPGTIEARLTAQEIRPARTSITGDLLRLAALRSPAVGTIDFASLGLFLFLPTLGGG